MHLAMVQPEWRACLITSTLFSVVSVSIGPVFVASASGWPLPSVRMTERIVRAF